MDLLRIGNLGQIWRSMDGGVFEGLSSKIQCSAYTHAYCCGHCCPIPANFVLPFVP